MAKRSLTRSLAQIRRSADRWERLDDSDARVILAALDKEIARRKRIIRKLESSAATATEKFMSMGGTPNDIDKQGGFCNGIDHAVHIARSTR